MQAAARALEALIREELPDVVVQFDPGNGLLAFGRSMKMRDLLFALIPHAGADRRAIGPPCLKDTRIA